MNLRPQRPKRCALTGLRYSPTRGHGFYTTTAGPGDCGTGGDTVGGSSMPVCSHKARGLPPWMSDSPASGGISSRQPVSEGEYPPCAPCHGPTTIDAAPPRLRWTQPWRGHSRLVDLPSWRMTQVRHCNRRAPSTNPCRHRPKADSPVCRPGLACRHGRRAKRLLKFGQLRFRH